MMTSYEVFLDPIVKSPSLAFLLHGNQKVRFLLSSQINDLKIKSLICAPLHLPVRAIRLSACEHAQAGTQTGGRDDDFL